MTWFNEWGSSLELGSWLAYSAISGLVMLGAGAIAVRCCREPIHRIRVIQWTFVACLLVPLVQRFELFPGFTVSTGIDARGREQASPSVAPGDIDSPAIGPADDFRAGETGAAPDKSIGEDARRPLFADESAASTAPVTVADSPTGHGEARRAVAVSPAWPRSLFLLAQVVYLALVVLLAARWIVGLALLRRMIRRCRPADRRVREVLRTVAGENAHRVRLLVSDEIASPVMCGLLRPTIVVPASHARHPNSLPLRWGLAHEWCHVLRSDMFTHQLSAVTRFICFFQPVYWWLKRELTLSQDLLADAFAARQGGAEEYAAFLVALAKGRRSPIAGVGLGINDGRSTLGRRIRVLLQSAGPPRPTTGRLPGVLIAAVAILAIAAFGSIRMGGAVEVPVEKTSAESDEPPGEEARPAAKAPENTGVDPITYTGRVIDRQTGKPIAGATVRIRHELSRDPKTGKWILLETTEHRSDENGTYSFTLPPEQVAQSSLYLEVNADHPNYQSKGWSGYSHTMIRTNLAKGDPPFYATIKLSPGEAISGIVTDPDGTPMPGVQIRSYTKGTPGEGDEEESMFARGAFQRTESDESGRFRLVVAEPGDGVLWIHPARYSALAHRIRDRRGDLGTFTLNEGIVLSGRVLDAKGDPVGGVGVNARRRGDGDEADEFLRANAVANGIRAGATTDADGYFQLTPLPPGTYEARIEEAADDPTVESVNWFDRRKEKMPHVFARTEFELSADTRIPAPITIQALPHVVIRGRFLDGEGQPRASHAQHFFGKFNGSFFFTESTQPGDDGWFEFRVPHGVTEAKINTMTNEHSALRWKLKDMKELTHGREIPLGDLEADVQGLVIVRYAAPILLVKAVDPQGNPIEDFRVSNAYVTNPETTDDSGTRVRYREGDVGFERQADGRWRSSQLLPDADIEVKATKDGYTTEPQVVSLKEKETRELTFVLEKVAETTDEKPEDADDGGT